MVQSILYMISFIALWVSIILCKKSDEKKNILVWVICGGFLVMTVQSFFGGILGLVHLPVSALTIGITNLLFSGLVFFWIKKKGVQHYFIKVVDVIAVVAVAAMIIWFANIRYGKSLSINFVSVDASVHCNNALTVALEHRLPTNMYFAAFNTGLIMDAYRGLTGCSSFSLYKIFVLGEVAYTAFSAFLFWALLRQYGKDKMLEQVVAFAMTVLYWIIYPAYSTMFGFSYFGMVVNILTFLVIVINEYLDAGSDRWVMIVVLNLTLFGVFVCYTLFVPTAFFGTFIALAIFMIRRDGKKFFNWKNILEMLEVFLIPTILGLLHSFGNVKELSSDGGGIAQDGGCYSDLYSNFILLIPFVAIGIYFMVKEKKGVYSLPMLGVQFVFMVLLFVGAMRGKVSAYYYMKNNSVLWVFFMFITVLAIYGMMERCKAAFLFPFFFLFLLFMCKFGDNWVNERNPRFVAVNAGCYFNVFYFNNEFFSGVTRVTQDEIDLYRYVYDNCSDAETICVNNEMENGWFKTLTGNQKVFCYGELGDFEKIEDDTVGYVCAVYSAPYEVCKDHLEEYEVVYENAEGKVYKVGE